MHLQFEFTKSLSYDDNGNLISVTDSCGTISYTWNARGQLVGISGYKPDCSALSATFAYDALGRRIQKTVNGKSSTYLYDGQDIVREVGRGGGTADYIRTLNIDDPLARIKSDGTIRHYLKDALGSVIALTDETGAVKTRYTYDPFGNTTVTGEESNNSFQYTGRENDGTGLYYYRARYYSSELQRFISEDPIGLAGGDVNFYGYVRNNPVNRKDPSGQFGMIVAVVELLEGGAEYVAPYIPAISSYIYKMATMSPGKPVMDRCKFYAEKYYDSLNYTPPGRYNQFDFNPANRIPPLPSSPGYLNNKPRLIQ